VKTRCSQSAIVDKRLSSQHPQALLTPTNMPIRGVESFSPAKHLSVRQTVMTELKARRTALNESTRDSLLEDLDCNTCRTLLRGKETGQWLSVMPSTLNGTKLSPQEFQDSVHLCYAGSPGDLPVQCKGCDARLGASLFFDIMRSTMSSET
jgi:hypothetical protein